MKIIYLTFLAGVALVAPLHADPIDDLAVQIKADYASVQIHTVDPEALRLFHDAQMVKDMEKRDQEVRADHEAYNKHLQEWLQKNKDADNARRLAEAAAAQAQIEARQKAIQETLARSAIRANEDYSIYMESHYGITK